MTDYIEQGDIYFFYRPKVNTQSVQSLDDVQRLHMVLVPDHSATARLFLVGKKRMPEILKGRSKSTAREWIMNDMSGTPKQVGEALVPLEYTTRTQGEQEQGEAIPVGEGRYTIFTRENSSRLAYQLSSPKSPGKAQSQLGILAEASYIISVRNPSLDVPGFPDAKPDYPKHLEKKFADKRWIDIDDSKLLDYTNAQLLLIGAHDDLSEESISITGQAALFKTLGLKQREWPTEALEGGQLTEPEMQPQAKAPENDRSKGGERGGKAATSTASAAGITQSLKGIDLPCRKADLIKQANANRATDDIVDVLNDFPSREYKTMADIQKALGEIR